MRVVIDTNIIVAALLSGNGKSRAFMNRVFGGEYEVIVSETILAEYERVFNYPKLGLKESTISFVLGALAAINFGIYPSRATK